MQIKGKYSWLKHTDFMIVDLISLLFSFVFAYSLKFKNVFFASNDDWIRYLFLVLILSVLIDLFANPYSGVMKRSYHMEFIKAFQLTVYNLLLTSLVFFAFKIGAVYSREMSFTMYGMYFAMSSILKIVWKRLLLSGKIVVQTTKHISLFIIGKADQVVTTIKNVTAGDFQLYDIMGIHLVDKDVNFDGLEEAIPYPIIADDYVRYILDHNIEEVLVTVAPGLVEEGTLETLNANAVGINVAVESAIGFQPEDQYIQNIGVYKSLSIGAFSFTPGQMVYLGVKRLIDICCGMIGLIVLLPVAGIVKIAYLISGDHAKIFYQQIRVGQNGKLIRIWKFRSMLPNADEVLKELLKDEQYRKEWEEKQKFSNDPRITKVGRILRKTSIDELPQLLNVLKGDMSLVGPRPLIEHELEEHGGLKLYEKVKPGITGWWGCNGRSNIDYRERLELEYYYVKNCSIYLDLLCILRTVLAVVRKDGAQ